MLDIKYEDKHTGLYLCMHTCEKKYCANYTLELNCKSKTVSLNRQYTILLLPNERAVFYLELLSCSNHGVIQRYDISACPDYNATHIEMNNSISTLYVLIYETIDKCSKCMK